MSSSTGFTVVYIGADPNFANYTRGAVATDGTNPSRELVLPAAGDYLLSISSQSNIEALFFGEPGLPDGSDDHT